jgi:hypothetical protein
MVRKVRKQVYIERHQERRLKERARLAAAPESELLRAGLDEVLRRQTAHRDAQAWRAEERFIARRGGLKVAHRTRTWSREAHYADRLSRRH